MPARSSDRERQCIVTAGSDGNCFHGELTRQEAEERLLRFSIPNSYLLRLSIYENEETGQISLYYALSFLTSKLVCQHYKLVPRLQSFQLGERLFQCLKCILSRYYQCPLVPGEYLRVPIPPCSPPQEFYARRVRAIRRYEPPCNLRLGCKPGDEFLVVDDESHSDWMLVTSVQTRQSGYLPKFCLEKVYPDIIERLSFFHEDSTSLEQQELLKRNGPFSYLLRLCDSNPGLYTLLVYDGTRILKYKIATSIVWWATPQPHSNTANNDNGSKSTPTTTASTATSSGDVAEGDNCAEPGATDDTPNSSAFQPFTKPLYKSVVKVRYNKLWYTSVEKVVAAIEAQFNQSNSPYQPCPVELKPVQRTPKVIPSHDSIYMAVSFNRRPPSPHAVVEIHGELSLWVPQKKKWKPLYASLDREQSIITLTDGDKRKPERIDLSRCDFFPVHSLMFDKQHCFGLLLSSTGEREDYVFAVEPPYSYNNPQTVTSGGGGSGIGGSVSSPFVSTPTPSVSLRLQHSMGSTPVSTTATSAVNNNNSNIATNSSSGSGSGNSNNGGPSAGAAASDLDPQAYAGRSDTSGNVDLAAGLPRFCDFGESTGSTWSKILASTSGGVGSGAGGNGGVGGIAGGPAPIDLAYMRWLKALAAHCRNTRAETAIDADPERRRSEVRCFRTLEVKLANAKLLPMPPSGRREGGGVFSVMVDGLEIARAYNGATNQTITFEEFPYGYKKVEVTYREDKKKRQPVVLAELQLMSRRQSTLVNSTSNISQPFSPGSSSGLEMALMPGRSRVTVANPLEGTGQPIPSQPSISQQQQQTLQSKVTLSSTPTPICCFQESVSSQATLIYRELYVLPFQCYDKLRKKNLEFLAMAFKTEVHKLWPQETLHTSAARTIQTSVVLMQSKSRLLPVCVITSHLETELVPACTYMWDVLASDQSNFQSSLLLACIESKRHLELIVNLLKAIIPADNPSGAFRSNALGQLIMEQYMNMVCSDWRQKCFRRVFNEIAKGAPSTVGGTGATTASASPPTVVTFAAGTPSASTTSRVVRFSSGGEKSVLDVEASSSSGSGSCNPPSGSGGGSELHRVSTCPPQHHREASPVASHSFSQAGSRVDVCSTQAEWHCSLVELLVEDLLEYAKEFPLQIRWIYSELQKCPELKSTNAVWCNLLFLRGICPSICKGSDGLAAESPVRDTKTFTTVAKILITLTSQKRSDNTLPSEVFESCRSKLLNKFAPHVLSPLSTEELNRLEGLYIEEAMRASANSMSRELAQLASYFQLVFMPDSSGGGESTGLNNARTLLNRAQLAVKQKPNVPNLRESLLELSQFTPTTSTSLHYHLRGEGVSVPVSASASASATGTVLTSALTTASTAIATATTTSVTTVSGTHSRSSGGLMRGLGGIFTSSSSTSLPKGSRALNCIFPSLCPLSPTFAPVPPAPAHLAPTPPHRALVLNLLFTPSPLPPPPPIFPPATAAAGAAFAIAIVAVAAAVAVAASSCPRCSEVFQYTFITANDE
ncbi:Ras GTPase-activating protein 1 [Taenia solium]|eukprot:TsM_000124400 transcript=TsM_000124400 gene=TsM_000124400